MPHSPNTPAPQPMARTAGSLYLVIIVFGIASEVGIRGAIIAPGDAAATAANILASQPLFRLGFAADSVMALCDVALAVLLFMLLRPVSLTLSLMAMAFRLVQSAILGLNLLNYHAALMVVQGGGFGTAQRQALSLFFLEAHGHGYDLGLLFFGLNSILTGVLLFRSGYFPRALGGLMLAAGVVYLCGSYIRFIVPAWSAGFAPLYGIPLLAELAFCLWLLIRGVNMRRWPLVMKNAP